MTKTISPEHRKRLYPPGKFEHKVMPGFSRYYIYATGKIKNFATGNELFPCVRMNDGMAFKLTNDKGQRKHITVAQVKAFFAPPVEKKPVNRKLDYEAAMNVRQRLAKGENRTAVAKSLGVDQWTICLIALNASYRVKEGDVNPMPQEMLIAMSQKHLPAAWKKKTREEIDAIVGIIRN